MRALIASLFTLLSGAAVADCRDIWVAEDDPQHFVYIEGGQLVLVSNSRERRYERRGAGTGISIQIVETDVGLQSLFHVNSVRGDDRSKAILIFWNQAWYPEKRCN